MFLAEPVKTVQPNVYNVRLDLFLTQGQEFVLEVNQHRPAHRDSSSTEP